MKLIEKTCPKCGANLEFSKGDKEIRCSYCNKSFLIEEDKTAENRYNLVSKATSVMKTGIIAFTIVLIAAIAAIVLIVLAINNNFPKNDVQPDFTIPNVSGSSKKDNASKLSLEKITKKDKEKLTEKSLTEIKNWNKTNNNSSFTANKQLGYYLLTSDAFVTLYDVYELKYNIASKEYTVYTAVKYNNVSYENKTINTTSASIFGTPMILETTIVWGYESIEDLFNSIQTPFKEKIIATKGLYIN